MTQQRLEQLRGNLANLRDSTDDFRAAIVTQCVIEEVTDWYSAGVTEFAVKLADSLGIAPDGTEGEQ